MTSWGRCSECDERASHVENDEPEEFTRITATLDEG